MSSSVNELRRMQAGADGPRYLRWDREVVAENGSGVSAMRHAWGHVWRFMPGLVNFAYRRFASEDLAATLALAAVECDGALNDLIRCVNREVRKFRKHIGDPSLIQQTRTIEHLSRRNARKFAAQREQSKGKTLAEMGPALAATIRRQPADHAPCYRGDKGNIARWGDYESRRNKARELRESGLTLKQIAAECGYKSASAVHAALKGTQRVA